MAVRPGPPQTKYTHDPEAIFEFVRNSAGLAHVTRSQVLKACSDHPMLSRDYCVKCGACDSSVGGGLAMNDCRTTRQQRCCLVFPVFNLDEVLDLLAWRHGIRCPCCKRIEPIIDAELKRKDIRRYGEALARQLSLYPCRSHGRSGRNRVNRYAVVADLKKDIREEIAHVLRNIAETVQTNSKAKNAVRAPAWGSKRRTFNAHRYFSAYPAMLSNWGACDPCFNQITLAIDDIVMRDIKEHGLSLPFMDRRKTRQTASYIDYVLGAALTHVVHLRAQVKAREMKELKKP